MHGVPPIMGSLLDEIQGIDTEEGLQKLSNHVPLQEVDRILDGMMLAVSQQHCFDEGTLESMMLHKARLTNLNDLKKNCVNLLHAKRNQEEKIKHGLTREYN